MDIPLFQLNYDQSEVDAIVQTLRSRWISTGPRCQEFEKQFASMLGAKFALATANCTSALHMAMKLINIQSGDEVITPSLTFVATANAILYSGGTPVFCDIRNNEDLNMDPDKVRSLISERTKAIVVMHYAGFPCHMNEYLKLAREHKLHIIEDACHGPLSEYGGRKLGTFGTIGCFSFYSNKNISTGEGGMLVLSDPTLYERAKLLRSHGMTTLSYDRSKGHSTSYDVVDLGYNYRLDDLRAALGLAQLQKLPEDIQKRKTVRGQYIAKLKDIKEIEIPFISYPGDKIYSNYIFPIVLRDSNVEVRDALRSYLLKNGVQTSVHYPAAHLFSIYKPYTRSLPNTEYITDNEITLPMYGSLTEEQISYIVTVLKSGIASCFPRKSY